MRSLWSNAKGNFTTKGQNGAAAVLGTTWLTRDHKVKLKHAHHLLAPAPGFS